MQYLPCDQTTIRFSAKSARLDRQDNDKAKLQDMPQRHRQETHDSGSNEEGGKAQAKERDIVEMPDLSKAVHRRYYSESRIRPSTFGWHIQGVSV